MHKLLKETTIRQWAIIALASLCFVALTGLLMRLKILLPMPAVNQKFVLHAHSHFAFAGWISHALMVFMAAAIHRKKSREALPYRYQLVILANLATAYFMLVSFFLQGYALYSIIASSLSVAVSYVFAAMAWRDMRRMGSGALGGKWFKAALVFLVVSSIGTFLLAYLMASHNADPRRQLAAVYFYLHFQYNGWFLFTCMGLLQDWADRHGIRIRHAAKVFWVFALACVPGYLLSVLWWKLPLGVYWLVVLAASAQALAWLAWLRSVLRERRLVAQHAGAVAKWLLVAVAIAATAKFLLQGFSVIPSLSQLAYSFRPIVIGYLHLVLLAVISLFVIAYMYLSDAARATAWAIRFTLVFVTGVVLNELLLMAQGVSGMIRVFFPQAPTLLAVAAGLLVLGALGLFVSQLAAKREKQGPAELEGHRDA